MLQKALLSLMLVSAAAVTQGADVYPSKPVRLVVPFASGSSTDVLARVIGERLQSILGQPFVIDNRPGAGGMIGTSAGAHAPADGYTLTMAGSGPFAINPAVYSKLSYDPIKDFAPIINLANTPQVLVTSATGPYQNLSQFIKNAKSLGKATDFASIGPGSTSHLAGKYFESVTGVPMNHIAFKANPDAQLQVMGGTVPVMFDAMPGVLTSMQNKKLRALAVAAKERSPFAPDVPTFAELGYPGMVVTGWIGMAAPAGTPEPILNKLNATLQKILQDKEVQEKLRNLAFNTGGGSRADFTQYIRAEIKQWSAIAKASDIHLD